MPLNPRQLKFVEGYLAGKSAKQAYIDAGYKGRGNAAEAGAAQLLRNSQVLSSINAANAKASDRAELTAEWVLSRLQEEANFRGNGATHSARIRALELLGKRIGLFPDRHEFSGPGGEPIQLRIVTRVIRAGDDAGSSDDGSSGPVLQE